MDLIKCKRCGEDTPYLATKECDRCHHANFVVRRRPDLIRKMLRENEHHYPTLDDLRGCGIGLSGRTIHVLSAEKDCNGKPVSYETLIMDPMALYRMRNCGPTTVWEIRQRIEEWLSLQPGYVPGTSGIGEDAYLGHPTWFRKIPLAGQEKL